MQFCQHKKKREGDIPTSNKEWGKKSKRTLNIKNKQKKKQLSTA